MTSQTHVVESVCACYPAHCENAEHGTCWCTPRIEDHSNGRLIIHNDDN